MTSPDAMLSPEDVAVLKALATTLLSGSSHLALAAAEDESPPVRNSSLANC
jgi:hypothetical protein